MALTAQEIKDEGDDYWIPTHDECIAEAGGALYELSDDDFEGDPDLVLQVVDRWLALAEEVRIQQECTAKQFVKLQKKLNKPDAIIT